MTAVGGVEKEEAIGVRGDELTTKAGLRGVVTSTTGASSFASNPTVWRACVIDSGQPFAGMATRA